MKKLNNISNAFEIIRNLKLPVSYPQVAKWVIEYEEKPERPRKVSFWLLIKYKSFKWWKK